MLHTKGSERLLKITVIGSINTDFVVSADKRPVVGETLQGNTFETKFGGKGANQAVASARLGVDTAMVGAVGGDEFGELLLNNLETNHISSKSVERFSQISSGSSVITVVEGDNSIIYVPGANERVHPDMVDQNKDLLLDSDLVIVQNEVSDEVIYRAIDFCDEHDIDLILNPAPARPLDKTYIDKLSYLTPNETEFEVLFPGQTMEEVLKDYPNKLIITLGSLGAIYNNGSENISLPSFKPEEVIDTTGAGDTFNGALAVGLVSDLGVEESIKFANLASSISIQKYGAQTGMPTLSEIKESKFYDSDWAI